MYIYLLMKSQVNIFIATHYMFFIFVYLNIHMSIKDIALNITNH